MTRQISPSDADRAADGVGYTFHVEGDGWRLDGDVDCSAEGDLREDLAGACAASRGDVHLMVDSLRFIDAAGARVLVDAVRRLDAGRRLVLHGLPDSPRKVFRLTGWDRIANLSLEEN